MPYGDGTWFRNDETERCIVRLIHEHLHLVEEKRRNLVVNFLVNRALKELGDKTTLEMVCASVAANLTPERLVVFHGANGIYAKMAKIVKRNNINPDFLGRILTSR